MYTFKQALLASVEWRIISFILQIAVLYLNGLNLSEIGMIAIETQIVLFFGQAFWIQRRSRR